jgi:hypothetical protein
MRLDRCEKQIAAEWIAVGDLGYVMGQSAVGVPSGDVIILSMK